MNAPLSILEKREKDRGNRIEGSARGQFHKVHADTTYDLEIDTHQLTLRESVEKITAFIHQQPMLNNLEEYADPLDYDLEYGQYTPNEDRFFQEIAQKTGGPILDIACGTGRVTIPLAKNGFKISGLDISAKMLVLAKEKAAGLPISWIEADCRYFHLPEQYALITMAGNAFQAMLTNEDQNNFLSSVKRHLRSGGLFVFDTRNPNLIELGTSPIKENWHTYKNVFGRNTQVSGYHLYNPLSQIATYTTIRQPEQENSKLVTRETHICLRYTYPQELETLLTCHGFQLIKRYGGYDHQEFNGQQEYIVSIYRIT